MTALLGMYIAEAAFMGLVFITVGAVSRAVWERRRER